MFHSSVSLGYTDSSRGLSLLKTCKRITPLDTLIERFMETTQDSPGDDRTHIGPMLAPWTLLYGYGYDWPLQKPTSDINKYHRNMARLLDGMIPKLRPTVANAELIIPIPVITRHLLETHSAVPNNFECLDWNRLAKSSMHIWSLYRYFI